MDSGHIDPFLAAAAVLPRPRAGQNPSTKNKKPARSLHAERLQRRSSSALRPVGTGRRQAATLFRNAQPGRHRAGPGEVAEPWRGDRAEGFRPRAAAAHPRRRLPGLPPGRLGPLDRRRPQRRPGVHHLPRPPPAPRRADPHGADGRAGLLQLRHRGADHRRHLAGHLQLRPGRADRPGAYAPGRPQRLRPLPSAGPSRRWRLHGRLLLPQQCRHRHPGVPRPGCPARGDPRCRLSPWQRHPGYLLPPRRCAVRLDPWRSAGRIPVLPRLRRRARRRRRRGLQPQLSAGPWQRLGPLVGGARRRLRADRRLRPGCPW